MHGIFLLHLFSVLPKVINTFSRYLGLSDLLLANTKRGREPSYDGTKKQFPLAVMQELEMDRNAIV